MNASHPHIIAIDGHPAQGSAISLGGQQAPDTLWVRPGLPSDTAPLAEMLGQLSAETLWNRFGMALYPLSPDQAEQLAARLLLATPRTTALVAVAAPGGAERIYALAQLVATADDSAEFALLVADELQGRGVGGRLLRQLIEIAAARGLRTLTASMRASNTAMLRLAQGSGLPCQIATGAGETDIVLSLEPAAPLPAAP